MTKIKKPTGLIRYSSQQALETGKPSAKLRVRVVIYGVALTGLLGALVLLGGSRPRAEVTILRGLGAPFTQTGDDVINQLRLKVQNREEVPRAFDVSLVGAPEAHVIAPELPLTVKAGEQASVSFFVVAPKSAIPGSRRIQVRVHSPSTTQLVPYTLLGPESTP